MEMGNLLWELFLDISIKYFKTNFLLKRWREFMHMLMRMMLIPSPACISSSQGEGLIITNMLWRFYSHD